MANWNNPSLASTYADFLADMKGRDTDSVTHAENPTNPPTDYIRYVRASNKFQTWNGTTWVDLVLAVAGGGTGGATPLGTMAFQNSNAVAVTGGTVSGLTTLQLGSDLTVSADDVRSIGTDAARIKHVFIKSGIAIPVGANKWIP